MGVFSHEITLIGAEDRREAVSGLVDTGALFTTLPRSLVDRLGLRPFRTMPVQFASGEKTDWPVVELSAELDGQRMPILALVGSDDVPVLIGAHTLEAFLLLVDPVAKELIPKPAYLFGIG
jgi:predicted aspartyl protease